MAEEHQGELFREFKEIKESRLRQLARKIIPPHRHFAISVSLENTVIIGIVILLGLILSYALGVEKGRRKDRAKQEAAITETAREDVSEKPEEVIIRVEKEPAKKAEPASAQAQYTVQLISFKSKDLAEKQVALLKKKGYDAFIIPKGEWQQICVGKYANKEAASKDLAIFEKEFKDCFLRRR